MTMKARLVDLLPWAAATLVVAAIVHVVSILLMPEVAPRAALTRLSEIARDAELTPNGVVLLPAAAPGVEPLPNEDPAFAEGACLFDLAEGLLRVRASGDGDDFLGLSFHSAGGRVFHAMTDRSMIKGEIEFIVGLAAQIEELENEDEEAPPQEVHLTAPARRGFVLIRSLAKRPSDMARARERLRNVTCETVKQGEG